MVRYGVSMIQWLSPPAEPTTVFVAYHVFTQMSSSAPAFWSSDADTGMPVTVEYS